MNVKEQQLELLRDQFPVQVLGLLRQPVAPLVGFAPVLVLETLCPSKAPGGRAPWLCSTLIKMPALAESRCQGGTWRGAAGHASKHAPRLLLEPPPRRHGSPTAVLAQWPG